MNSVNSIRTGRTIAETMQACSDKLRCSLGRLAQLYSELLKQTVLRDFAGLWPEKFCNVTDGITPRRFAVKNPGLTMLIAARIGDGWLKNLDQFRVSRDQALRGIRPRRCQRLDFRARMIGGLAAHA